MGTDYFTAPRAEWLAVAESLSGLRGRMIARLIADQAGDPITLKRVTTARAESWAVPSDRELRRLARTRRHP